MCSTSEVIRSRSIYHMYNQQKRPSVDRSPAISSGNSTNSSRRGSAVLMDNLKDFVRKKRAKTTDISKRKSSDLSHYYGNPEANSNQEVENSDTEEKAMGARYRKFRSRRRCSVPEGALQNGQANFAIVRHNSNRWDIEVVASFDRNLDPFMQYLQTMTCYDLVPQHATIAMIDSLMPLTKALLVMKQSGKSCCLVVESKSASIVSTLTYMDCLRAVQLCAVNDDLINQSLDQYLKYSARNEFLVTAQVNMTLWDAGRVFCDTGCRQVVLTQTDETGRQYDAFSILSLRNIFSAPVIRQLDRIWKTSIYMGQSVEELQIGNWTDVLTIGINETVSSAIDLLLSNDRWSVPVVDSLQRLVFVLNVADIAGLLADTQTNNLLDYQIVLNSPISQEIFCQNVPRRHSDHQLSVQHLYSKQSHSAEEICMDSAFQKLSINDVKPDLIDFSKDIYAETQSNLLAKSPTTKSVSQHQPPQIAINMEIGDAGFTYQPNNVRSKSANHSPQYCNELKAEMPTRSKSIQAVWDGAGKYERATCKGSATISTIIEQLVHSSSTTDRLYVVDTNHFPIASISVIDIFQFICDWNQHNHKN